MGCRGYLFPLCFQRFTIALSGIYIRIAQKSRLCLFLVYFRWLTMLRVGCMRGQEFMSDKIFFVKYAVFIALSSGDLGGRRITTRPIGEGWAAWTWLSSIRCPGSARHGTLLFWLRLLCVYAELDGGESEATPGGQLRFGATRGVVQGYLHLRRFFLCFNISPSNTGTNWPWGI